jgi:replicative superfamily II helicase
MIDFSKRLDAKLLEKKTHPVEIYDTLDRISDKGPLRPAQEAVLNAWYENNKEKKDVIIKLHTGQGKTLVGLLILQSRINAGEGSALYICPNKYLVEQTCEQAKQFGIKICRIDAQNVIPNEFWEGKSILITHAQKVFNGRSIFGLRNRSMEVDSVVLDDSHACIDTIRESFTIRLSKDTAPYKEIFELFESDLEMQGIAHLEEIRKNEYEAFLSVPYWSWQDKIQEVAKILVNHKDLPTIGFAWEAIKDRITDCQCIISGYSLEISPYFNPIELFGSFHAAKHRVLMSATTNNDSFFIKGLGFSIDTVKNPIVDENEKWSGEKMILVPYFIDYQLDRVGIVNHFAKPNPNRKYGIVSLTPSIKDAEYWTSLGSQKVDSSNIDSVIKGLKEGYYENTIVIANRYDGIDLPDDSCRILILDSKPFAQTLSDIYQEYCRTESEVIDIKIAQKIEQGFGRGVRGEKDYCIILVTGSDLINTIKNKRFQKFFSSQTKKQIDIGLQVTGFAVEEAKTGDNFTVLAEVMKQCLKRDEGWKRFYYHEMNSIKDEVNDKNLLEILTLEKKAEDAYFSGNYPEAITILRKIINEHLVSENKSEIGWYLQEMARFTYIHDKAESNRLQLNAHKHNKYLLKPKSGVVFEKLLIHQTRIELVKDWTSAFENFDQLIIAVDEVLFNLVFGNKSEKFERALMELGKMLGFGSDRPDKTLNAGPDNLWNVKENEYILFECKNEVKETRAEILKSETGQMNNSCGWFNQNYPNAQVLNIMIVPTNSLAKGAAFNEEVRIMREVELKKLVKATRAFFNDFKNYDLKSIADTQYSQAIKLHKLDVLDFKSQYSKEIYRK